MPKIIHMIAPKRWWHWPLGVAFWGFVSSAAVYLVEYFWKPEAIDPPLEHYLISTATAAPLIILALGLIAYLDRLHRDMVVIAATDPLTWLMNRRAFLKEAEVAGPGALLMIDLDHFKQVNDTYGHPIGDAVLVLTAKLLRKTVRQSDLIGRLGGEEFAMFLATADQATAAEIGGRLAQGVTYNRNDLTFAVTASVGAVSVDGDGHILAGLHDADEALYRAKNAGRAQCVLHQKPPLVADAVAS